MSNSVLWRAAVALAISLVIGCFFMTEYAQLMLPVVRHAFAWWIPEFRLINLQVLDKGADTAIEATFLIWKHFMFYGHVLPTGGVIRSSTLAGHMLVHFVLLAVLLAAWPVISRWEWLLRALLLGPVLAGLAWIDPVGIMIGSMHGLILENISPQALPSARFVIAMQLLENGGRYLLVLIAGASVLLIARNLPRQS